MAVVALLRAVGHVLEKVDAAESPAVKRAVDEKWLELKKRKPEPQIFWSFIKEERDRFIKNYKHGIERLVIVDPRVPGKQLAVDTGNSYCGTITSGSEITSRIASGPFKGERERDVAWMAHDWWCLYLDEIDSLAKEYS
ncbi:MAG: hypothetical protein ACR2GR_12945, partial [Rhodothermales bacterium]